MVSVVGLFTCPLSCEESARYEVAVSELVLRQLANEKDLNFVGEEGTRLSAVDDSIKDEPGCLIIPH